MLVLIGGIDCDESCHALDAEKNTVSGLYVAGNIMGGRFLVDYPVTVAGASHSMAIKLRPPGGTHGRRRRIERSDSKTLLAKGAPWRLRPLPRPRPELRAASLFLTDAIPSP